MKMSNRVVVIPESILTEDMETLHLKITECINILNINNLSDGIETEELTKAIENLKEISDVLKYFSRKDFICAGILNTFIKDNLL